MWATFRRARALRAFALAVIFLSGTPYLFWRSTTRGRFLAVAGAMQSNLFVARGIGALPPDEEVATRVRAIAAERQVEIDGLRVTHREVGEPIRTSFGPPEHIAEYAFEGTMRTSWYGVEATAPMQGSVQTHFVAPTAAD